LHLAHNVASEIARDGLAVSESRRRARPIGQCIYCGDNNSPLSDEHVVPYGLGGDLVLAQASCKSCAAVTGRLEQQLLRGHWWPYRRQLGLATRRPGEQPDDFPAELVTVIGEKIPVRIRARDYPILALYRFEAPAILSGSQLANPVPVGRVWITKLNPLPSVVGANGQVRPVLESDKIEYPIMMDARQFVRFLAKVALGYAVSRVGIEAFAEIYANRVVLGDGSGALIYVGEVLEPEFHVLISPNHLHGLEVRRHDALLSVLIQLFRKVGEPPPVYEVVVGRYR
jgi:hypothetical protein